MSRHSWKYVHKYQSRCELCGTLRLLRIDSPWGRRGRFIYEQDERVSERAPKCVDRDPVARRVHYAAHTPRHTLCQVLAHDLSVREHPLVTRVRERVTCRRCRKRLDLRRVEARA